MKKNKLITLIVTIVLVIMMMFGCSTQQDSSDSDEHISSYTITFDANGGEGSMEKMVCLMDHTYDVPECLFTYPKAEFVGWDLLDSEEPFSNLSNKDGDTIVMKAQWKDLPKYGLSSYKGNIVLNYVEYKKTGMKQVLETSTVITCDQTDGVFTTARSSVTIDKYAIGKYPVTQELYTAVMGSNPSSFTEAKAALGVGETDALLRPVDMVCWYDAITFCNKLSLLMGKDPCYTVSGVDDWSGTVTIPQYEWSWTDAGHKETNWDHAGCDFSKNGYRLPTECEWECAARGGTYSAGTPWTYRYSGSDTIDDVAWYLGNSNQHTWEVGLKHPNTLGLYDMCGNIDEWCWDYYNTTAIDSSTPATGPVTTSTIDFCRRTRGEAFGIGEEYCSVSKRTDFFPDIRNIHEGFRLVCSGE